MTKQYLPCDLCHSISRGYEHPDGGIAWDDDPLLGCVLYGPYILCDRCIKVANRDLELINDGWKIVTFASDLPLCECCLEPYCKLHEKHYADCDECIGPTEDECEYQEVDGVMYGRRLGNVALEPPRDEEIPQDEPW